MTFFPIHFLGFIFFSDETLRHGQMFQRIGELECQNNSLGFSGLWVTLKEFNPISYIEALKIMKQIHLITRESKPDLVWQIRFEEYLNPKLWLFQEEVFYSEMHNSLLCVHKKIKQFTSSSSSFNDCPLKTNRGYGKT